MTTNRETKQHVPRFRSLEEEADFWDTHSPEDFPEQWSEVKQAKVERPLGHILGVRLDAPTIAKLAALSRKKGIGPSTLARIWIMERLTELEESAQDHPSHSSTTSPLA